MRGLMIAMMAVVLMALPASAMAQEITVRPSPVGMPNTYTVKFTQNHAAGTITNRIPACATMSVTFFQSSAADVTLYEVDPDDDTSAEVTGATPVKAFTASTTTPHVFRPGKLEVRFAVVTAESSSEPSIAVVSCINAVASVETLARWPIKGATALNNAISGDTCVFPFPDGGTPWVIDTDLACFNGSGTSEETVFGFARDTLITGMASIVTTHGGAVDRGCTVCLSSDGADCDAGTIHNHPNGGADASAIVAGDVFETEMSVFYPAGTLVELMVGQQNPGDCETPSGGVCFCSAGNEFIAQLDGIELL